MGGKSSKKQQVKNDDIWKDIPTSGHSIPRSAPTSGRGTSTSPSEAWERGSEDFNGRDQHEWFNSTNSSYNLLDLQPYYSSPTNDGSRPFSSPKKKGSVQRSSTSSSPPPRRPRWQQSPSPTKTRGGQRHRSPSSKNTDKFSHFRNITEKRDNILPPSIPESSPKKSYSKYNGAASSSYTGTGASSRSKSPRKSKSSPSKNYSGKSPYEPNSPPPTKKKINSRTRPNSFPDQSPVKNNNNKTSFKKPKVINDNNTNNLHHLQKSRNHHNGTSRRASDVSTIGLEAESSAPVSVVNSGFRPIKNRRTFSVDSIHSDSPYQKKTSSKVSSRAGKGSSQSKSSSRLVHDNSFANLSGIKSATNSVQSTRSNFEVNVKVEKFNDRRQTLAILDLAKHTLRSDSFRDAKLPGGPEPAYEEAKRQIEKEDWEPKISGIEKIVTVSRKAPDILRNDIKTIVRLMLGELKNLRSQVCRSAALAWSELFYNLGKSLEPHMEDVVVTLLQKSADTNKFIRDGCVEALLSMVEHVSIYKAITTVYDGGLSHKSAGVRTQVAMLVDHVISALGPEKFYGSSKDTQTVVFTNGTKMLADGSLEVRTHAKHMLGVLARHVNFEPLLKEIVPERERRGIQKSLDAIVMQNQM